MDRRARYELSSAAESRGRDTHQPWHDDTSDLPIKSAQLFSSRKNDHQTDYLACDVYRQPILWDYSLIMLDKVA